MTRAPRETDFVELAQGLATVGYPVRLALLDTLRSPKLLREIRVRPFRRHEGHNPARPVSRQTIRGHLDRLLEAGIVLDAPTDDGTRCYVADPGRLYSLAEDLRELAQRYDPQGVPESTRSRAGPGPPQPMTGPRLVVVHGVREGQAFGLAGDRGPWTIGRKDADVTLDYDPFVSHRNAEIRRDADGYSIRDLPTSKNGTRVNWTPLRPGATRALATGDLIGVGRSLLLFRQA